MVDKYFYIDKALAEQLIEQANSGKYEKGGTNSRVAILGDYAILKTGNIEVKNTDLFDNQTIPFDKVVEKVHALADVGVSVVPIIGYCYNENALSNYGSRTYAKGYIIQQRAKGSELWQRRLLPSVVDRTATSEQKAYLIKRLEELASAPQSQYDKFISDLKAITDAGIKVDPKKENFFYDAEFGFSFIDLNFFGEPLFERQSRTPHDNFIEYALVPYNVFANRITNFTRDEAQAVWRANTTILDKCVRALTNIGIDKADIDKVIAYRKYTETSPMLVEADLYFL